MTLTTITEGLQGLLETNNYNPETIKVYRREWNKIGQFLHDEYGDEEFEMERGLAYLEKHGVPAAGKEAPRPAARKPGASGSIPRLNLEDGMPLVSEALDRMHMGLQEMRVSRVKIVKLIHGYGSTGRGGRIGLAVREDLAGMKRKRLIQGFIPGEDFGPMDPASRRLAERDGKVPRDPDYGRMNHGITLVIL